MPWRSPDRVGVRRVYFTSRVIETSPSSRDDAPGVELREEDDMNDRTGFLRRSLLLDGIASGLTGALLLVGAGPLSAALGFSTPGPARGRRAARPLRGRPAVERQ